MMVLQMWRVKKSCPSMCPEGSWGERRYSFYSFLTFALDGASNQHHTQAVLGKDSHCPLDRRLEC
jgi:hypothetical protein